MKELLSPAGNMECLKAAVNNGADAIYLGGKTFGARAYAGNFSNEELKEAVNYAHLYGVKIYITVNTIIYNTEVDELIKYIEYLYKKSMKNPVNKRFLEEFYQQEEQAEEQKTKNKQEQKKKTETKKEKETEEISI